MQFPAQSFRSGLANIRITFGDWFFNQGPEDITYHCTDGHFLTPKQ